MKRQRIILASRSPARKAILKEAGLKIGVAYADIDESRLPHESVQRYVMRVAYAKAEKVASKYSPSPQGERAGVRGLPAPIIIGVDTVIAIGAHILGKPKDRKEAARFLKKLSGRWHKVYSGTVMLDTMTGKVQKRLVISKVKCSSLTPKQIDWYIATGEPFHAAGAYSIQGKGRALIESVDGCLTNIIGVSIPVVFGMLKKCRVPLE